MGEVQQFCTKKTLKITEIKNFADVSGFELIVIDFYYDSSNRKKIRTICCYRPPSLNYENSKNLVDIIEGHITLDNCFIVGDFNLPDIDWNTLSTSRSCLTNNIFIDFCINNGLVQLVDEPTRISKKSDNILDIVLTNTDNMVDKLTVGETPFFSDHLAVSLDIVFHGKQIDEIPYKYLDFKKANYENIEQGFQSLNWFAISESLPNVQDYYDFFVDFCSQMIDKYVPKKTKQEYNSKRNRFPKNIRDMDKKKKKLWNSIKMHRKDKLLKTMYRELDKSIYQMKKTHINNSFDQLSNKSTNIYKYIKLKLGNQKRIPPKSKQQWKNNT